MKAGEVTARSRLTDQALARTDLIGKLNVGRRAPGQQGHRHPGLVHPQGHGEDRRHRAPSGCCRPTPGSGSRPGSRSGCRRSAATRQGEVALFPTCLVEYQNPAIGQRPGEGLRAQRHRVLAARRAGLLRRAVAAPGDVDRFVAEGRKNVKVLADAVRGRATTSWCPSPRAATSSRRTTSTTSAAPDAELVADHTYDAAEYLMKVHKGDDTALDTEFTGDVPERSPTTRPATCGPRTSGCSSRDLMKLTGTKITLVAECSGIDGTWGYREPRTTRSPARSPAKMAKAIEKADNDVVAGDCNLANGGILQETGTLAGPPDPGRRPRLRHPRRGLNPSRTEPDPRSTIAIEQAHPRRHRRPARLRARARRVPHATSSPSRSGAASSVGPVITFVFENRDTIRFQIQEMARVEKLDQRRGHRGRARRLQPADPRAGHRCRPRCSSSSPATTRCASGCPSSSASKATSTCGSAPGTTPSWSPAPPTPTTRSSSPATRSPRPSTTCTGTSRRSRSRRSRPSTVSVVFTHPNYRYELELAPRRTPSCSRTCGADRPGRGGHSSGHQTAARTYSCVPVRQLPCRS